ncbi:hypothetical protein Ahy_B02g057759 isoform E [Arachis hypogaea]|uniref:Uncharacterized protein n=1 Tax=Arachis hypogaea TaxID=3818 RepID=A0A445AD27_ARAHY|nr:hypothetical protein Ahy_B02g057759 isoform E [Arachis hypogaea]
MIFSSLINSFTFLSDFIEILVQSFELNNFIFDCVISIVCYYFYILTSIKEEANRSKKKKTATKYTLTHILYLFFIFIYHIIHNKTTNTNYTIISLALLN